MDSLSRDDSWHCRMPVRAIVGVDEVGAKDSL